MAIFTTSNHRTTAGMAILVRIAWVAVLLVAVVGVITGVVMVKRGSLESRMIGIVLVLGCGAIPCRCYLGPPHLAYIGYGNYPGAGDAGSKARQGMTKSEVNAVLGTPHDRDNDRWSYWLDSYGMRILVVHFDRDDRVASTSFF